MMAVFSSTGIQALGWTLVHSIWQVSLIAILLMAVLAFINKERSALRYLLSLGAMFTAFTLSLITFLVYYRSFAAQDLHAAPEVTGGFAGGGNQAGTDIFSGVTAFFHQHLTLIVTLWLLGVLLLSLRFTGGLWYLRRLRKTGIPVNGEWWSRIQLMATRMGLQKAVVLAESNLVKVPVMIGWLKPVILVPAGILSAVPPEQLEAILAHELAHIRRNDYLMNILQSLLEIIYFFHPVMWWMSRLVRREREVCCDDAATQMGCNPVTLAYALSEVSEMAAGKERFALAFAGKGEKSLLMRVKRLLGHTDRHNPVNILPAAILVTGLVLCLLVGGAGQVMTAGDTETDTNSEEYVDNEAQPVDRQPVVADTTGTDTLTVRRKKGSTITVIRNGKGEVERVTVNGRKVPAEEWEDDKEIQDALAMQKFSFSPDPPAFPPDFTPPPAPEFDFSEMPKLDSLPAPPAPPAVPPIPDSIFKYGQKYGLENLFSRSKKTNDTIDLPDFEFHFDESDWEEFGEKMEEWGEKFGKQMETWAQKHEPQFEEFGRKIELWAEQNEPRMKEYEERMEQWEKDNKSRMEDYERRMKEWERQHKSRMEDYERKMKEWQEKNKPRMEEQQRELQRELQEKRKEDQKYMEEHQRELQRRLQEQKENKDRTEQLPDTSSARNNNQQQALLKELRLFPGTSGARSDNRQQALLKELQQLLAKKQQLEQQLLKEQSRLRETDYQQTAERYIHSYTKAGEQSL